MKRILSTLLILITLNCFAQQNTVVRIPPSKDTTVITFKTTTTTTANTVTTYSSATIPTIPPVVVPPDTIVTPPVNPFKIEGYGALAGGANTTKIYHVTNLKSTGQGSLNYILSETNPTGYRIVFDVSGQINQSHRVYSGDHFTIDGSTAPFPGINIKTNGGDGLVLEGSNVHHIIVRGLVTDSCSNDGIAINDGAHDITITNCTSYGNGDGNIDISSDSYNNSIQFCIIGNNVARVNGNSGGSLLTGHNNSFHHNLCYPAPPNKPEDGERFPYVHHNYGVKATPPSPDADVRNNLIWNWGRDNSTGSGFGIKIVYAATGNAVNNYLKTISTGAIPDGITTNSGEPDGKAYIAGNVSGNGFNYNAKSTSPEFTVPAQYQITMQDACSAAKLVLQQAGITQRDSNSKRRSDEQVYVNNIILTGCN